jgi:hypothetical protein
MKSAIRGTDETVGSEAVIAADGGTWRPSTPEGLAELARLEMARMQKPPLTSATADAPEAPIRRETDWRPSYPARLSNSNNNRWLATLCGVLFLALPGTTDTSRRHLEPRVNPVGQAPLQVAAQPVPATQPSPSASAPTPVDAPGTEPSTAAATVAPVAPLIVLPSALITAPRPSGAIIFPTHARSRHRQDEGEAAAHAQAPPAPTANTEISEDEFEAALGAGKKPPPKVATAQAPPKRASGGVSVPLEASTAIK